MPYRRFFCLLVLVGIISMEGLGQSAKPLPQMERLRAHLQEMANAFPGTMGIAVRDISAGQAISINGDRMFPMASAYKIPILVEVFRQAEAKKLSLDDRVELASGDRTLGSGVLTLMSSGLTPTIKDLATLMIVLSDNEATDVLLNKVGAENVTATMRSLGLKNIRVDRTTFEMIRDYLALIDEGAAGKSKSQLMNRPQLNTATPERVAKADAEFAKYFPFWKKRLSLETVLRGRFSVPRSKPPYYNNQALGYGGSFVRGYEYYVADGLDYGLLKTAFHVQLFDKTFDLGKFMPLDAFRSLPVKIYLSFNNDLGYANDPWYADTNPLSNHLLWGYGFGLDLLMWYNNSCRFEWSWNDLGENGFFLRINAGL